jgi:two-component system OmpR family sensor kinase
VSDGERRRGPRLPARLRWRLTALTVLLLAAALAFVGVVQYLVLRGYLVERTYQAVSDQMAVLGKGYTSDPRAGPPVPRGSESAVYDASGRRIDLAAPRSKPGAPGPIWADLTPAEVRSLAAPLSAAPPGKATAPEREGALPRLLQPVVFWVDLAVGTLPAGARVLATPAAGVMVTAWPLDASRVLVVETSLLDVEGMLRADVAIFSVTAVVALLATAVLAVWLTSRALSPLERVAAVAREISAGAYDRRTGLRGGGEVASLAAAFDEMVDRLERQIRLERESEARMRRFLADASHELRTPITGILGHLEVLRRGALDSRADLEESLAAMHLASERMARLVADLLTLTRFEQAETRLRAEPVGADELLRDAARAARPSTRGHLVALDPAAGGLAVHGDRDALERILVNLLDNAARYSPPGTRIGLGARCAGAGRVELLVSDRGPGVPPEERERIFERLYRGDRSRRAAEAGQGAGLGLSICRALARRQGGDVTVRDGPEGGATFEVTMPAAEGEGMSGGPQTT